MSNFMKKPNIIVHLDLSPQDALERIRMRNRGCESGISLEYLESLHAAYEEFIAEIARVIPVIKVDYSEFRSVDEMAMRILAEYEKIANIRSVTWGGAGTTNTPIKLSSSSSDSSSNAKGSPDTVQASTTEAM
jgi:deoxyadenosine kinase